MAVVTATPAEQNFRDRLDIALERIGHRSSPVFRDALARAFDDETGPAAFPLVTPLNRNQRRAIVRAAGKLVAADPALTAWALEAAVRERFPDVLGNEGGYGGDGDPDRPFDSLDALHVVVDGFDALFVATGRHAAGLAEETERERLVA